MKAHVKGKKLDDKKKKTCISKANHKKKHRNANQKGLFNKTLRKRTQKSTSAKPQFEPLRVRGFFDVQDPPLTTLTERLQRKLDEFLRA